MSRPYELQASLGFQQSLSLFAHYCHRDAIHLSYPHYHSHELLAMPPYHDRLYLLNSELEMVLPHSCFSEDSSSVRRKALS